MSAPSNKTTSRGRVTHRIAAVAVLPVALAAALAATTTASASPWDPEATQHPQVQTAPPNDWPDEGKGFPGYADQSLPTGTVSKQANGLDTTSVALGVLAGIALGGAGLGVTLVVLRRRDTLTLPAA